MITIQRFAAAAMIALIPIGGCPLGGCAADTQGEEEGADSTSAEVRAGTCDSGLVGKHTATFAVCQGGTRVACVKQGTEWAKYETKCPGTCVPSGNNASCTVSKPPTNQPLPPDEPVPALCKAAGNGTAWAKAKGDGTCWEFMCRNNAIVKTGKTKPDDGTCYTDPRK